MRMATLTHVVYLNGREWEPITARKAAIKTNGHSVSVHSGLFKCELCNQYVTLVADGERAPFFRHSRGEDNKNCPERTIMDNHSGDSIVIFNPENLPVPLRLKVNSDNHFERIELGLLAIPENVLQKCVNRQIRIFPQGQGRYVYNLERLKQKGITYVDVGMFPAEKYLIRMDSRLKAYLPSTVAGISEAGAVFDTEKGKMLPRDADVRVGRKYYILRRGNFDNVDTLKDIQIDFLFKVGMGWRIYKVKAKKSSEAAVKFFMNFHCQLTDDPVQLKVIWPLYKKEPYLIKHNKTDTVVFAEGNHIKVQSYPEAEFDKEEFYNKKDKKELIVHVKNSSRNQVIFAGRSSILKYMYLWKEKLDSKAEWPLIEVKDIRGNEFADGIHYTLPIKKRISITCPVDGFFVHRHKNRILEKRSLPADESTVLDGVQYDDIISIFQGLDKIYEISFVRRKSETPNNEMKILQKLSGMRGQKIVIGPAFGTIVSKLIQYPGLQRWIIQQVRHGYIYEEALRYLKHLFYRQII